MAKKVAGNKKFEFSAIGKIMSGIADKTSIMIEDASTSKEYIQTGIYILNALLTKSILRGGIQNNRITVLSGESGVGKSFVAYNIAREAQSIGYNVIYIDTEFSVELSDLEAYGIESTPDKLMLVRSNIVEDIKVTLTQLLDQLKAAKNDGYDIGQTLIILDSAGQLASRKEVEDAKDGKEKADMTRAKALKSLFRIINSDLGFLKIPLLVTNHTYMSMDLFPQPIMSGGCLVAGNTIIMEDGSSKDIENVKVGDYVMTMNGPDRVADKVSMKKNSYEVELEDGTIFICSDEHRFLIGGDWSNDDNWVKAMDLTGEEEIISIMDIKDLSTCVINN